MPSVLAVNPDLGVNNVAELIELLKKNPGKYNFGSIGNGFAVASDDGSNRAEERRQDGAHPLPVLAGGHDRAYSR